MADTHDNVNAVDRAVEIFNSSGVDHVLHAGDLVSPFVVACFAKLKAKLHYVWGNNEGDKKTIEARMSELGLKPLGSFAVLRLNGKRIALLHGSGEELVDLCVNSGSFDLVVRGHTHRVDVKPGKTLCVNPGEVCGYLSGERTVAIVDLDNMDVEIVKI
ncbi:MAG: metallophosphoesterase [Candidatus Hadarchaeales archaeon]